MVVLRVNSELQNSEETPQPNKKHHEGQNGRIKLLFDKLVNEQDHDVDKNYSLQVVQGKIAHQTKTSQHGEKRTTSSLTSTVMKTA